MADPRTRCERFGEEILTGLDRFDPFRPAGVHAAPTVWRAVGRPAGALPGRLGGHVFIRDVDEGLERLVRERLPLPEEVGDVSFEAPTSTWAAQLSRLTVNLFLYGLDRSTAPTRAPQTRIDAFGKAERRAPQPMVDLDYLVSAWAGSPRDEHQLFGDVVSLLAGVPALPPELAAPALSSTVTLTFGSPDQTTRPRDVWQGVNGQLKACVIVRATVATDTWDWEDQAAAVERVAVLAAPKPMPSAPR